MTPKPVQAHYIASDLAGWDTWVSDRAENVITWTHAYSTLTPENQALADDLLTQGEQDKGSNTPTP